MTRGHQVPMLADLAIVEVAVITVISPRRCILRRRCRWPILSQASVTTGPRAAERHVVHARIDATHLQLAQLVLKELEVASTVAHLRVEAGADGLIVRLCTHGIGSVDEGLFALDLLVDILGCFFLIHGGGRGRDAFAQDVEGVWRKTMMVVKIRSCCD